MVKKNKQKKTHFLRSKVTRIKYNTRLHETSMVVVLY